jgi:hypothetical protein
MMFWVELAQCSREWPISLYRGTKRYVQVTEYMYRDYTEIYNLTSIGYFIGLTNAAAIYWGRRCEPKQMTVLQ